MSEKVNPKDQSAGGMAFGQGAAQGVAGPAWIGECALFRKDSAGQVQQIWNDDWHNAVQLQGKIDLMNRYFGYNTKQSIFNTWYCALHSANATFSTAASLSAITASEVGGYSAQRLAFTMASNLATQSYTTTFTYAFTAGTSTVSGLFIAGSGTLASNTAGTDGVLYSAGNFNGGSRQVQSGDTLNVTLTLSMA